MWTIATPFVNKPDIIPIWLESFKQLDFPRNEFKLLWIDMTDNPELTALLKSYITEHGHEFAEVEYIDNPQLEHAIISDPMFDPENPLYKKKSLATDESMAIIREKRKGHLLLWEDDMIVPPDGFKKLKQAFDASELFLGVSGTQYFRSPQKEGLVMAWKWDSVSIDGVMRHAIRHLKERPRGIEAIGATASGFVIYRDVFVDKNKFQGWNEMHHDMVSGLRIQDFENHPFGGLTKMIIVWDVKCPHLGHDKNGNVKAYKSVLCKTEIPVIPKNK